MPCNESDIRSKQLTIRWSDGSGGNPTDDGTRPLPDPTAYWESPDLWLTGGVDKATAKVGVPNQVWGRVFNFGQTAVTGVSVEVWICNFTLGVNPASSLASSNPGGAPMTGYYSGTLQPGGSQDIAVTGPGNAAWTPTNADAALNGGHVCMAGNCFGDNNDSGASFTGTDMKFLCNCHHGQHNIAVVAVPMGMMRDFHFRYYGANPEPQRVLQVAIAIRPVQAKVDLPPHIQRALLDSPHAMAGVTPGIIRLASHLGDDVVQWARSLPAILLHHPSAVTPTHPLNLTLRPQQQELIEAHLKFQSNERPGNVHIFDLTEHETNGALVGGARLVTVITP